MYRELLKTVACVLLEDIVIITEIPAYRCSSAFGNLMRLLSCT